MKIAICFYGLHPDETWKSSDGNVNVSIEKINVLIIGIKMY